MAYSPYANPVPSFDGMNFDSLSLIRQSVLRSYLPMVIPSTEGDKKFDNLMTHEKCVERRAANPNFTTCGSLPGWLFSLLGMSALANYGLGGVRDAALKLGCWVKNDELNSSLYSTTYGYEQRPQPGDVYLLSGNYNANEILHIGVIVNSTGERWWTADAGQGVKETQQALWLPRKYLAATRQLDGETYGGAGARKPRRLIGWVDLDRAWEVC